MARLNRPLLICLSLLLGCSMPARSEQSPWFVGMAIGSQQFDTSLDIDEGDIDLLFDPDDDGDSFGVEVGRRFGTKWIVTAEYSRTDADTVEIDNWFLSLNRRWVPATRWELFAGALAGASTLDWQDAPVETVNRDRESDDFLWGLQAGAGYRLTGPVQLQLRYQYLAPEHNTRLRPVGGRGEYTHEKFHHVSVGLQWHF